MQGERVPAECLSRARDCQLHQPSRVSLRADGSERVLTESSRACQRQVQVRAHAPNNKKASCYKSALYSVPARAAARAPSRPAIAIAPAKLPGSGKRDGDGGQTGDGVDVWYGPPLPGLS